MSDTIKYKTVSLKNDVYSKLEDMSGVLVEGVKLSIPQTIELLLKQEEGNQELKSGWGK
jgi:predicted CopG family antitoxin